MNNCIKEYQNNECYRQELKFEKGKLHIRYLLIIATILVIVGVSAQLGNDNNFSAQISMASTISSIILSAIAIFMSISGENKNSYVQNQMSETSSKLSGTVKQLGDINETILTTLDDKLKEISEIKDELKSLSGSVDSVHGLIGAVFDNRGNNELIKDEIPIDKLYKEIRSTFNEEAKNVFANVVRYMLENNYSVIHINEKAMEIYEAAINRRYIVAYGYMIIGAAVIVVSRVNEENREKLIEVL